MILRPRSRALAGWLGGLMLTASLAGCADDPAAERPLTPGDQSVQVDTGELVAAKRRTRLPACEDPDPDAEMVAGGLPEISLPCLGGGGQVNLAGLRGPMVVNLWQVACPPCREEMPVFEQFHRKYGDQVAVLGIDYQDVQVEPAIELAGQTKVSYPNVADPDGLTNGKGGLGAVRGFPTTLFIDDSGKVAWVGAVVVEDLDQLRGMVDDHLGVSL